MRSAYSFKATLFFSVCIGGWLLLSCDRSSIELEDDTSWLEKEFLYSISFIGDPIQLMSTTDAEATEVDNKVMGYFNIVKVKKDLYYMYYIAVGKNEAVKNESYDLCMAWSKDGFHWMRGKPDGGGNIVMPGIIEQSVFMVPDKDNLFRLVGNEKIDGKYTLCMWKSKDGISFTDKKILLTDRWHDTQNAGIVEDGLIKVFVRLWNPAGTNRQNGVVYFDLEGNQLTTIQKLAGDYLYNAAPLALDDRYQIILPTFFNNKEGLNDNSYIKAYLVNGLFVKEINCDFNKKLSPDVGWVLVSPYLISIGEKNYISYYTSTTSHDTSMEEYRVNSYYLLEVVIKREHINLQ